MAYADYLSAVLASGPNVFWKCDEASGLLQDSSGNARHATTCTGLTYQDTGPLVGSFAVTADAVGDIAVRTGVAGMDAVDNMAIEAWMKFAAGSGTAASPFGVDCNTGAPFGGWRLRTNTTLPELLLGQIGLGGLNATSDANVSNGTWYHVVLCREAGTWKMYINGILQAITDTDVPGSPTVNGVFMFQLPSSPSTANTQMFGSMSLVSYFQTALTASDVTAHYNAALTSGGIAAQGGPSRAYKYYKR